MRVNKRDAGLGNIFVGRGGVKLYVLVIVRLNVAVPVVLGGDVRHYNWYQLPGSVSGRCVVIGDPCGSVCQKIASGELYWGHLDLQVQMSTNVPQLYAC